ncbi:MAG: hypothetical protein AAGE52_12815 [Myxococcota bacterium]
MTEPYDPDGTVAEALARYFEANGWSPAVYDEPYTEFWLWRFRIRFPNTPRHRLAIRLHDLHHCVTGYGTDFVGEWEVSAWELRRGVRTLGLYVASIVCLGAVSGFLLAPRRTLRAWRAGKGPSLFDDLDSYEELLALPLRELRARLGVPPEGLTVGGFHRDAPARAMG